MAIYSLPPLFSAVAFVLLILVVLKKKRTRISGTFIVYLVLSTIYCIGTFVLLADFYPNHIRTLTIFPSLFAIGMSISYYHFICDFTQKREHLAVWCGYGALVFILVPLFFLGYFPKTAELTNRGLHINYGIFIYPLAAMGFTYLALSIVRLIKKYRDLTDPLERSRVLYLFVGVAILSLLGIREGIPPLPMFPLGQIGHLGNALIITYTIIRYQLLDIRMFIRKSIIYAGIVATITGIITGIIYLFQGFMAHWPRIFIIMTSVFIALTLSLLFNYLKIIIEKVVNIVFYGRNYDYRKLVMSFTRRMGNVLDLSQLAEAMLEPIAKALSTTQTSLLLPDDSYFDSRYAIRFVEDEKVVPIKIRRQSQIITWLTKEKKPLSRDFVNVNPNFKALWEIDVKAISDIELLFPLVSNDRLIAILTLSKRRNGGLYNSDDLDLITTLTNEAAVGIENAQLYLQAKERVNVDDLTGLFNHRYFHQRVDEEIARASRFGEVFCLLSIDLDLFKIHNDIHGHLYGDEILKRVGEIIRCSIRSIDMAFRYGGDEFSVILPQTSIDGAYKLAERIRKSMESEIDTKSRLLTCSIGIATWPTDGVMREELIQRADSALYFAKQVGGNRISLASKLTMSQSIEKDVPPDNNRTILSTIYALAATVDAKDHYTYGHSKKVSRYATDLAKALGLSDERVKTITAAALLHDIGKIGVSDEILKKVGPLNDEEWKPIYAHPTMGVSILKHVESLKDCLAGVQYHHEHYDGSGYPSGLKGSNIPLDARILSIADAFDAMTSSRPYRKQMTSEKALEEIRRSSGIQFDPDIARIFIEITTLERSRFNGDLKIVA
jgi:diguanylate cyclase (GGDEF)-like protein/putative nucleotidyltransferase with HDIG domain